jgi:hypothetical protein
MNDSEHPKSPATTLLDKLPGALLGLLIAVATWAATELGRPVLDAIAQASTTQFLLRALVLLVVVLLLCGAYIFHLRSQVRKPLSSKYDFESYCGHYIDRKTGRAICARCLADGIITHLMDVDVRGGGAKMCNVCQTGYRARPKDTTVQANKALQATAAAPSSSKPS